MYKKRIAALLSLMVLISCVNEPKSFIKFDGPTMAISKQNGLIYVADGYYNSRILIFDSNGNYLNSFGSKGYDKGEFQNPHSILLDFEDNLWVADRDNGRIQIFDNNNNFIKEVYGENLGRPWSLAITKDGLIYSLDGGDQGENKHAGLSILNIDGEILSYSNLYGNEIGKINWGHSISVNSNGSSCYITDIKLNYICKLDRVLINNENRVVFNPDFNWIYKVNKYVLRPLSIVECDNELFVGEDIPKASIKVFNSTTGEYKREILQGIFKKPHSISIDNNNFFWITDVDYNKVYKVSKEGEIILTLGDNK